MTTQDRMTSNVSVASIRTSATFYIFNKILSTKNLTTFVGYIRGPPDSCYSNAVYELSILVGSKYPFEAPKVSFNRSSIPYHPNVSSVIFRASSSRHPARGGSHATLINGTAINL